MTKIYAQGNYLVIEANNGRNTFQKKGVGFEIVNEDGLYSLNYKGLPIGDFNYSEVKKEDGLDYTTALEFETFLFENTGNFNSGAVVPPNYIPLTGTEEGKPVTGDIIIEYNTDKSIRSFNEYGENAIIFNGIFSISNSNHLNGTNSSIALTDGGDIYISSTGIGIRSNEDHSDDSPENKLIYAQRSYVERPETLINCLNNATPAQLSTIKSILGIV